MSIQLVTGGAGFIGSHLVEALLAQGHHVRVLDNFSTGNRSNLNALLHCIELIEGDITDLDIVQKAMDGVEVVFHQAALASVPRSISNPLATNRACVDGTLNVLIAARDNGVRRLVYAGSSSAYGNSPLLPRREDEPVSPMSPYAVAKLAGEQYCMAFTQVYGLETVRLRYFNVFGPRQSPRSAYAAVIPLFIQAMTMGRSPIIHGDGDQSRDFTFVSDVVRANILAAMAEGVSGKVYNVACGKRTSLLQVIEILNRLLGTEISPDHGPARPGDVRHSQACIQQAQKDLGFTPTIHIEEGLRRCLAWWQQSKIAAKGMGNQSPKSPARSIR